MSESHAAQQKSGDAEPVPKIEVSDDLTATLAGNGMDVADAAAQSRKRVPKTISTLDELVTHAYSRKGQRVRLNKKAARSIAEVQVLFEELLERVATLAETDVLLAVPRQLLLLALQNRNVSKLWLALQRVVDRALESHPCTRGFIARTCSDHNIDLYEALEEAVNSDCSTITVPGTAKALTKTQVTTLRMNVAYTLSLWLVVKRGVDVKSVVKTLYSSLWEAKGDRLRSDSDRLRAVTDVRQLSSAGLLCAAFVMEAKEHRDAAEAASRREAQALRQIDQLQTEISGLKDRLQVQESRIEELRTEIDRTAAEHQAKVIHLKDDYERLRTRVLRRLRNELDLLEEGLQAIRRNPPRLQVMEDHADRVIIGLRDELRALQAEVDE